MKPEQKTLHESHAHLRRRGQRRTPIGCAPVLAVVALCLLSYCFVSLLNLFTRCQISKRQVKRSLTANC